VEGSASEVLQSQGVYSAVSGIIIMALSNWGHGSQQTSEMQQLTSTPFLNQCELACRLFARHSFQEAGQTLICATTGIKKILLAEHPGTLFLH